MKKRILILGLILLLLLSGCTEVSETYTVTVGGTEMTVNVEERTISHGTDQYSYVRTGFGIEQQTSYQTTIYYPNGGKWTVEEEFVGGLCVSTKTETSENFDGIGYLSGEKLLEAVKQANQQWEENQGAKLTIDWGRLIFGTVFLIIGAFGLILPEQMWNIRVALKRWRYRDPDPTEAGLEAERICGGILLVIGVILILISF